MNDKKKSYGWIVFIACLLIQALPYAIITYLQPQFMTYVIQDKSIGFSIASFSLIFSIGTLASALASPIVGGLFKKFGLKPMYIAGALLGCGGFAAFSVATSPWQFYLIAVLMQVGAAIISALGIPLIINSWFDDSSRGKALSIVMAGGSLSNAILQTVCVSFIQAQGFKKAYLIFGLIGLVVALVAALFMLRLPKDDSEVIKLNSKKNKNSEEATEESKEESAKTGFMLKEAFKTKGFKLLVLGFFFVGLYSAALATQYPNYLHQNHEVNTGTVGTIFALCSFAGSLVGGTLFDKIGPFKTMLLGGVLTLLADVCLIFALDVTPLAYAFPVAKGLCLYTYTLGPALLVGKLFGNKDYASILGIVQLVFGIGYALGSSIFGALVNGFGYTTSWYAMAVAIVAAFVTILASIASMNKLNKAKKSEDIAA
ncbi:MAG: conjugated bile salt MFS transporter [Clostridiales bacterium]|uniref:conjugated bile salt MFS transporter n=1 Tax=Terrisporobacter sp. TaxID=1965305 RepID=UPI002A4CB42F|nr:conjugated bile salt MFS transporter [Terrisporobacter sp.]MCI6458312.1 conjugated bile salt MFS transporter [Clostridium sp.]MDD5877682.1 conjugated bile salt MFS transporter [Clostridiales bacterium]MCI7204695.1 conjugated bile salt MFS transporter [Clostridium sp.]MDD7753823.1 conjugated bile salt MFS transporter [Clostridiales bacterium]MDY4134178.1 conjugated bile salt MFS transporter [Terrisporobacter sp.]